MDYICNSTKTDKRKSLQTHENLLSTKIKATLEFNENEGTAYSHSWDAVKAVLREKFITLHAFIKKLEISQTSTLKTMGQNNHTSPTGVDGRKSSNLVLKWVD